MNTNMKELNQNEMETIGGGDDGIEINPLNLPEPLRRPDTVPVPLFPVIADF